MFEFRAVTIRRFKSAGSLAVFMEYLKKHVSPEVHVALMKTGHAKRTDEEIPGEAIVSSAWMVTEIVDDRKDPDHETP
jgi:hypothetical protein